MPGDCFQDVNGNGSYDLDRGRGGMGGAEDVVRFQVRMIYPRLFPVGRFFGWSDDVEIVQKHRAAQPALCRPQHRNPGDDMLSRARPSLARARGFAARLRGCDGGLAFIEFAMSLPVLVTLGLCGLETANLAMAHLRVSNIAMLTADNASRVRDSIDEANVIELLTGAKMTGDSIEFRQNGRIILSSVETDNDAAITARQQCGGCDTSNPARPTADQWIRWQRCDGARNVTSAYGAAGQRPECGAAEVGSGQQHGSPRAGHRGDGGRGHLRLSAAHLRRDLRPADHPLRKRVQRAPADQPGAHQHHQPHRRADAAPATTSRPEAPPVFFL